MLQKGCLPRREVGKMVFLRGSREFLRPFNDTLNEALRTQSGDARMHCPVFLSYQSPSVLWIVGASPSSPQVCEH